MRPQTLTALLALCLCAPLGVVQAVGGVHYGEGNLPRGCSDDWVPGSTVGPHFVDGCYHMRTGLNDLDTPLVDVLIVPPASPHAERDLRAMRQVIEMYEAGIKHVAPQMGLDWLAEGMEFNVLVDDNELTTYPAWDPEIVIVMANPVVAGVQGIGIDPLDFSAEILSIMIGEQEPIPIPCRGANPLATFEAWSALPGFDSHHDGHSGTYVEECGSGGSICYAVNLAIDPVPGVVEDVLGMNTFDLVAHEVGHCLSLGHVGDAGDHSANAVPVDDIMSYTHNNAPGKCVSSLDVEALALTMSEFLLPSPLAANQVLENGPFQVQAPEDHFYASTTGLALDCPNPDLGLVPLQEPVSFTPSGGALRQPPSLEVTSHEDGDAVAAGLVTIEGTVRYDAAPAAAPSALADGGESHEVVFEDDGDPVNTFFAEDTTLGSSSLTGGDTSARFTLDVTEGTDVVLRLTWTSVSGTDDLDLHVSGVATQSSLGTLTGSETISLTDLPAGELRIQVDPFLVSDPLLGVVYTLVAEVSGGAGPNGPVDADGDGVADADDLCPATPTGTQVDAAGCPVPTTQAERVEVRVEGVLVATELVDGRGGDTFAQPIDLAGHQGPTEVRVGWYDGAWLVREQTLTLQVA